MRAAAQAVYALGACGAAVFVPERSGVSALGDEINRRDANAYLAKLG
jgi:hypothetical protein